MRSRHVNIPIFLPELACPHRCLFCNQSRISGQHIIPSHGDVTNTIEKHLGTIPPGSSIQVAFFGGSFTGLPARVQEEYLGLALPYLRSGVISGIRVSTRPDYITGSILDMLASHGVVEIELGAQSFDDAVLKASRRGHTSSDISRASSLILAHGIRLGLQMMIGLPGDTSQTAMQTARAIVAAGAHSTRIYPTLVIKDTPLAELYARGMYTPLALDQAVELTKDLYLLFEQNDVTVLRAGLHPSEDFNSGESLVDGPYHPSFKELVLSRIWHDLFGEKLPGEPGKLVVHVPERQINHAIGYNSVNLRELKDTYGWVRLKPDTALQNYEIRYSYH